MQRAVARKLCHPATRIALSDREPGPAPPAGIPSAGCMGCGASNVCPLREAPPHERANDLDSQKKATSHTMIRQSSSSVLSESSSSMIRRAAISPAGRSLSYTMTSPGRAISLARQRTRRRRKSGGWSVHGKNSFDENSTTLGDSSESPSGSKSDGEGDIETIELGTGESLSESHVNHQRRGPKMKSDADCFQRREQLPASVLALVAAASSERATEDEPSFITSLDALTHVADIGGGGYGTVLLMRQNETGRAIALKVIRRGRACCSERQRMHLLSERRALAELVRGPRRSERRSAGLDEQPLPA